MLYKQIFFFFFFKALLPLLIFAYVCIWILSNPAQVWAHPFFFDSLENLMYVSKGTFKIIWYTPVFSCLLLLFRGFLTSVLNFLMNLMPPGGGEHPLQIKHQLKVKKGEFINSGNPEQKSVCWIDAHSMSVKCTFCGFISLCLHCSFLSEVPPTNATHLHLKVCVYLISYMCLYVSACAYLGQSFLSIFTAGLQRRVVKVMCQWCGMGASRPPQTNDNR